MDIDMSNIMNQSYFNVAKTRQIGSWRGIPNVYPVGKSTVPAYSKSPRNPYQALSTYWPDKYWREMVTDVYRQHSNCSTDDIYILNNYRFRR